MAQTRLHSDAQAPAQRLTEVWILAGQSNMVGMGMTGSFERTCEEITGAPLAALVTAVNGSNLAQWAPAARDDPESLYGALLCALRDVDGRIAGVLWYQGESEACDGMPEDWQSQMLALQRALRSDAGDPELPFYHVQLGRFVGEIGENGDRRWSHMREQQRLLPSSGMVSAVDLDLEDYVHVSAPALQRLGRRLANLVSGAATAIRLRSIDVDDDGLGIVVAYDGVNGRLSPGSGHLSGFSLHGPADERRPAIVHAAVTADGDAVRLRLTRPVAAGDHIAYGYGMDPQVRLRDSADMSAPAFGPLPLDSRSDQGGNHGR
jgi:Carbohydrate esterase, sialic acid-specific acetylesterase